MTWGWQLHPPEEMWVGHWLTLHSLASIAENRGVKRTPSVGYSIGSFLPAARGSEENSFKRTKSTENSGRWNSCFIMYLCIYALKCSECFGYRTLLFEGAGHCCSQNDRQSCGALKTNTFICVSAFLCQVLLWLGLPTSRWGLELSLSPGYKIAYLFTLNIYSTFPRENGCFGRWYPLYILEMSFPSLTMMFFPSLNHLQNIQVFTNPLAILTLADTWHVTFW